MKSQLYFDINQLPTVLTLREAALYMRCDVGLLKRLSAANQFPAYKYTADGWWYVDRDDMLAWIESRKGGKTA